MFILIVEMPEEIGWKIVQGIGEILIFHVSNLIEFPT